MVREALAQAISAGDMKLALKLVGSLPAASTPIEARMLQVAEALRSNDNKLALALLRQPTEAGDVGFAGPFLEAWVEADAGNEAKAIAALDGVAPNNLLAALEPENRALILIKFRRTAQAQPFIDQALKGGGIRSLRMRLAFADALVAAGDKDRAQTILQGLNRGAAPAAEKVLQGKSSSIRIDNSRRAFAELLDFIAVEFDRMRNEKLPVSFAQVARYAAPESSATAHTLGLMLGQRGRADEAIGVLRGIPAADPLAAQARDTEVRSLVSADRDAEALQVAQKSASAANAGVSDYARLGDVLSNLKRYEESAGAYNRAVQMLGPNAKPEERWPLLFLEATSLEEANHWPETRDLLGQALALAPDQPIILNFLGYAKLERGEDLDTAEAMIRKASALAPDDASITDSLGWAVFKRGRTKEAIEILTRAAKGDPAQAEIHEHLGDALYKAGNKFEARYSWSAALITAENDDAVRLKAKLDNGLTPANAAP
ncbi:tetratricopeptide repeat protein [Sphingomonas daechungensis]|uniref:tetratricopeptide repeat protein n=1 Tax=Sphingomonas daechungensis TaxID=1176646 RepID=UPI0031E624E9